MMIKYSFYLLIAACVVFCSACDDFLDEKPDSNLVDSDVFSSVANTEAAVAGAYRSLVSKEYYGQQLALVSALSAQELRDPVNANATYQEFINHNVQPTNAILSNLWASIYNGVQPANKIIAYAPDVEADEALVNRFLAEAHFLRGLHYFNLVRLFGNIPLYLTPITSTEEEQIHIANSTIPQVYEQIVSDLTMAESMMPADFQQRGRASIWAVKSLLAKVHLYLGNYDIAAAKAQEVLAAPFSLSEEYGPIFVSDGDPESILEIWFDERTGDNGIWALTLPVGDPYNGQGVPLIAYSTPQGDTLNYPILNFYPEGDLRKESLFYNNGEYYYVIKYTSRPNFDDISLIRLPEVMLIYAEAAARSAGAVTQEAFDAYNAVRIRANVPDAITNYPTVEAFVNTVVEEKRRELLLENEAWFDYVRAGKADELGVTDPNHYIFPIPQEERDFNPKLTQNPGY
ncbi:MAG: RagB/SusD family nutrient uptake outer membrane protein [Cyclobacteriaceae bacterium]